MVSVERGAASISRIDPIIIDAFKEVFAGLVIQPGDPGYDDTRKVWNGMIDKRPALIAQCSGVADVIQAVRLAGEQGLAVSVRGGGHNVAGHAVSEGGLMIDLSHMRAIHVDPKRPTAQVQGGATWGDFDREAAVFGLATTGGVISTTGVAGLTLGGGMGWLVGKYGPSIDNLLSVELVTAAGEFLRASEDEHPDLFWALRGGGGNFGVVTSFEFKLHPVGEVLAGFMAWPVEQARAVSEFYRDFTRNNPEEMTTYLEFAADPESGERAVIIAFCYPGDITEGERLVEQLRAFSPPVMEMVERMPYRMWNGIFDAEFPHGWRYYWKGVLLQDISNEVVDALIEHAPDPPLASHIVAVEHYRGAMNRVDAGTTAFPHREAHYQVVIAGKWESPQDDEGSIKWVRGLNAALEPYSAKSRLLNFNSVEQAEQVGAVRASFGPNYDRLVSVKRRYDPGNLFHGNHNIPPE